MANTKADTKADMELPIDRGEDLSMMEPLYISESSARRSKLNDLVIELASRSAGFRRSLPDSIIKTLADLVRSMNCYYSNFIEGHDTHPVDIERALQNDYSSDLAKRNLQLEAKAHVSVQKWIDNGGIVGRVLSVKSLMEIHNRFCSELPEELLRVFNPSSKDKVKNEPGKLRDRDVQIGGHVAVSPGAVPRFLARFESAFASLGKSDLILSAAAQHHRLLWIHPFLDGNGRVARLMSHAVLREALDTGSIWSVARGLARRVSDYKGLLANCDLQKRNALDGRGYLSEEALEEFSIFFLEVCIDQVKFMEELMEPNRLRARILLWAEEEVRLGALSPKTTKLLESLLFRGSLARREVPEILGSTERHARRLSSELISRGILVSSSSRAPLHLNFPAALASRWMPALFPDKG